MYQENQVVSNEGNDFRAVVVDNTDGYKPRVQGHRMEFINSISDENDLAQRIMDVLVASILSSNSME